MDDLDPPSWDEVLHVVEQADEAGRSRAYAGSVEERDHVERFFAEERDEITRRVGGAVKTSLNKAECDCEVETYGRVSYALKESVNRQLERRTERRSEAQRYLERNEETLGKKNAEALSEKAGMITETSHIVFVELPTLWAAIEQREGEARRVARTLEDAIDEEKELAARPEISKAERKGAEERAAELEQAKVALEEAVPAAKELVAGGEEEINAIRAEYEEAFDALCASVSDRGSAPR
jgi:hypothetical protein